MKAYNVSPLRFTFKTQYNDSIRLPSVRSWSRLIRSCWPTAALERSGPADPSHHQETLPKEAKPRNNTHPYTTHFHTASLPLLLPSVYLSFYSSSFTSLSLLPVNVLVLFFYLTNYECDSKMFLSVCVSVGNKHKSLSGIFLLDLSNFLSLRVRHTCISWSNCSHRVRVYECECVLSLPLVNVKWVCVLSGQQTECWMRCACFVLFGLELVDMTQKWPVWCPHFSLQLYFLHWCEREALLSCSRNFFCFLTMHTFGLYSTLLE